MLAPFTQDKLAAAVGLKGVEVATVDGFQGREKTVIVFVSVRSNPGCTLGFLDDPRRLNVALTRAAAALVVVGDARTLAADAVPRGGGRDGAAPSTLWAQWMAIHHPAELQNR